MISFYKAKNPSGRFLSSLPLALGTVAQKNESKRLKCTRRRHTKNLLVVVLVVISFLLGAVVPCYYHATFIGQYLYNAPLFTTEDSLKHNDDREKTNYTNNSSGILDNFLLLQDDKLLHGCIYYIHLDSTSSGISRNVSDRLVAMEKIFQTLPRPLRESLQLIHVSGYNVSHVKSMLQNGSLILNGIKEHLIVDDSIGKGETRKQGAYYSYYDIAVSLSHLKAIQQAYSNDNCMSAMILEDNAELTVDFLLNWRKYAARAPNDWKVLQWTTSNRVIHDRAFYLSNDYWISWKPYHWSTTAYEIHRDGMRLILDRTFKKGANSSFDQWVFDDDNLLLSDEVIYYHATPSYTSTFPWFRSNARRGVVVNDEKKPYPSNSNATAVSTANIYDESVASRQEKIAVIMSCRWKGKQEILQELHHLIADILELAKFNPNSYWFLNIVLTSHELLSFFHNHVHKIPSQFSKVHIQVRNDRFNKFLFVHQVLEKLVSFDYVLLKDNDIRLSGFPWNMFMNIKNDALLAAPFYETMEELLYHSNFLEKTLSNFQNAAVFNRFDDRSFMMNSAIQTMAIEQGFALLSTNFSIWYFSQVLTDEFLGQVTDWGPDMMWCGAAHSYHMSQMGNYSSSVCSLIPLNILHANTKQLQSDKSYSRLGRKTMRRFKENSTFLTWISARPRPYYCEEMLKRCKTVDGHSNSNSDCAIKVSDDSVKIWYEKMLDTQKS